MLFGVAATNLLDVENEAADVEEDLMNVSDLVLLTVRHCCPRLGVDRAAHELHYFSQLRLLCLHSCFLLFPFLWYERGSQ